MALRVAMMLGLLALVACQRRLVERREEVVCEGDLFGSTTAMVDDLGDCTVVTGNLIMTGNALFAVELPALVRVDGTLSVSLNPVLTHIDMPELTRVGGTLRVNHNDALTSLELPSLARVNERSLDDLFDLAIHDNPLLPACHADVIRDRLISHGFHGSSEVIRNDGPCPE